jgi:hypothetical protein
VPAAIAPLQVAGGALATGAGGVLTQDAADAYVEALEFVLAQIGKPDALTARGRLTLEQKLADAYPGLPVQVQTNLAQARAIWTQYQAQWDGLDLKARREFAYYVLAVTFGEPAAAQALGISPQQGTASTGSGTSGGDYRPTVDDMMGSVPGSDCWSSAGCTNYDSSTNTYTFESPDSE